MVKYDFDKIVDRTNSNSCKWDTPKEIYGRDDIIPFSVADMDFEVPKEIRENIGKRIEHEVFGYTSIPDTYYEAAINWFEKIHDWKIEKDWMVFSPGVVTGLNMLIRSFSKAGDEVIIQTPVYHQFHQIINNTGRKIVENPLIRKNGDYFMDFENLEKVISHKTRILILCNPHNPVGRAWKEDELRSLGEICFKNNILVISDEIHSDLVFKPKKHLVFSNLGEDFKEKSIVCTAPNKTFNIAGFKTANIIIANEELRKIYESELEKHAIGGPTMLAMIAQESAYKYGYDWYEQVLDYIEGNIDYACNYIEEHIPKIKLKRPEATYLLWLDCSELGLRGDDLFEFFVEEANLYLNSGQVFSKDYDDHVRVNLATRRELVEEFLKNLELAVNKL